MKGDKAWCCNVFYSHLGEFFCSQIGISCERDCTHVMCNGGVSGKPAVFSLCVGHEKAGVCG